MNKNVVKTIRINDQILEALEDDGWTVQKLIDWAISKKVKIQTTIKLKRKGKRK